MKKFIILPGNCIVKAESIDTNEYWAYLINKDNQVVAAIPREKITAVIEKSATVEDPNTD